MKHFRTATRRNLDRRLAGLREQFETLPPPGWIRTMRDALGMSTYELANRIGLSQTRVRQFETAEIEGSIRLTTLRRAADALNCRLLYVFVPNESLEDMVHARARSKAATLLGVADPDALENEAQDLRELQELQRLEDLAMDLVDRPGLWS